MPIPPSLPPSLDRTVLDRLLRSGSGRSLLAALRVGETVTARVAQVLAPGAYLVALRGAELVASGDPGLAPDSVARFMVAQADDGQLALKYLGPADGLVEEPSSARTAQATVPGAVRDPVAQPAQALARLGLPDTPPLRAALATFVATGAPLQAQPLQAAAQAVAGLPAGMVARVLAAHANLSRVGLPATPPLLALAAAAPGVRPAAVPDGALPAAAWTPRPIAAETRAIPAVGGRGMAAPAAPAMVMHQAIGAATSPSPLGPLPMPGASTPGQAAMLPDLALELPERVLARSLALAGARIGGPEVATDVQRPVPAEASLCPLVQALAHAWRSEAEVPAGTAPGVASVVPTAGGDLLPALRQLAAESLLPPQHLQDYDVVLPFPLALAGRPVPARLAIRRQAGGRTASEAIYLRIDADLVRLGPLSLRLGSAGDGILSLVLVASGRAVEALAAELPDLEADLQQQGLRAHIRVLDQAELDRHG